MKKLLAVGAIVFSLTILSTLAQGTIHFSNASNCRVAVDSSAAPVLCPTESWPSDGFYVPAGNTTLRVGLYYSLTENGAYTKIAETGFSAFSAGRFGGVVVAIPGVTGGTAAWFQVRVWERAYGDDFESAYAASLKNGRQAIGGVSNRMRLPTGLMTPTVMALSLQPFAVGIMPEFAAGVVPEPSTCVLAWLGLAGWLVVRRHAFVAS